MASLAANRAASEASGRVASAGVNRRGAQARGALERGAEAGDVDDVDPDAEESLDRDRLGQVAGLVDVVAEHGRELAGEQLQRDDGDERLEQHRHLGQADQRGRRTA